MNTFLLIELKAFMKVKICVFMNVKTQYLDECENSIFG